VRHGLSTKYVDDRALTVRLHGRQLATPQMTGRV